MLAEDDVGLWKTFEQTVVNHGLCAFACFFRGLEDRHQRAAPGGPRFRQQLDSAREPCDMHVVAAHVRDRNRVAFSISGGRLTGIGKARRFLDRQRVHVGAQHDGRAIAVAK